MGIHGRLDAHAERLRIDQVQTAVERGLPADLVATETNVWRRLSPARNRWPEIAEFDMRVAELEMRQAAKADELQALRDREMAAPAADAGRLASWQLEGEKGPRPEPELPQVREQIRERQEEWEALTVATGRVLAEKAAFVEKHRRRLVKSADEHADEAYRRHRELIDQLTESAAELAAARRATVWARLYPDGETANEPPDQFCGGRAKPLRAMGLEVSVSPSPVFDTPEARAERNRKTTEWLRSR